jgi:hypothetical protein
MDLDVYEDFLVDVVAESYLRVHPSSRPLQGVHVKPVKDGEDNQELRMMLRGWVQAHPTNFMEWLVTLWNASSTSELPYDSLYLNCNIPLNPHFRMSNSRM